jgi:hypothetical protein
MPTKKKNVNTFIFYIKGDRRLKPALALLAAFAVTGVGVYFYMGGSFAATPKATCTFTATPDMVKVSKTASKSIYLNYTTTNAAYVKGDFPKVNPNPQASGAYVTVRGTDFIREPYSDIYSKKYNLTAVGKPGYANGTCTATVVNTYY